MIHKLSGTGKKAGRRILALTLALGTLITGCGSGGDGLENILSAAAGGKWIDSDVYEFVEQSEGARPQDDFALAATKKYLEDDANHGILNDVMESVFHKKIACLKDTSLESESFDEVLKYAELAQDWDYRDSQGVEPLRKYIESIEAISDLDSLFKWMNSPETNPLSKGPIEIKGVGQSKVDPTSNMTYLEHGSLTLEDPNYYYTMTPDLVIRKEQIEKKITYVLDKLGYDAAAIDKIITGSFATEKKIAGNTLTLTEDDRESISYNRDDLKEAAAGYPLLDFLDARGYGEAQRFFIDISYLRQLERLFGESSISELKDYLIVQYVLDSAVNLDSETFDTFKEIDEAIAPETASLNEKSAEHLEYDTLFENYFHRDAVIGAAFDKAYLTKYADPSVTDRLYKMTEKIIETYHDIFNNESWLSDEGKALFIEKLDAIKIHILYPDNENLGLSDLNIVSKEDGGSFLEAAMEAHRVYDKKTSELSTQSFDRAYWDPFQSNTSTTTTNAYYNAATNGIYILAGIIEEPLFTPDISDEDLYAGIGVIVGHELTHGFDAGGVRFDKDGVEISWVPDEDIAAFIDKTDKVAKFYTTLVPYTGSGLYDGNKVQREATADMGGLRVTIEIGKTIPGFDFDRYFRQYAKMFICKRTLEEEKNYFTYDEHPLGFYRVNVGLMQFEEFYETYDVKPGDGMYLEEKKRIAIW